MISLLIMWIEVSDNILHEACHPNSAHYNDIVLFLERLADAAKYGKHIVVVPTLNQRIKSLSDKVSKQALELLKYHNAQRTKLDAIEELIRLKAFVSLTRPKNLGENIWINPLRQIHFEPYIESQLFGEDISDCEFLFHVLKLFMKTHHMTHAIYKLGKNNGGGRNIGHAIQSENVAGNRLCLAIADSDKHYPTAPIGGTGRTILDYLAHNASYNCRCYVMENVMEVENLIPQLILMKSDKAHDKTTIFQSNWAYYDIKNGLSVIELAKPEVMDYFRTEFHSLQLGDVQKYIEDNDDTHYKDPEAQRLQHQVLDSAWGDHVLTESLKTYASDFQKLVLTDLTVWQQKEWEIIGRWLFSFGCCFEELERYVHNH